MTGSDEDEGSLADTAPLRGLGTFPRTDVLLGELITDQKLIPSGSQDVTNLAALPSTLKSGIERAVRLGSVWVAWTSGHDTFAITAEIDAIGSRMHAKPVLQVLLLDGKGRVIASSTWLEVRPNRWTACASR